MAAPNGGERPSCCGLGDRQRLGNGATNDLQKTVAMLF
jgi:hypothetical protein